MTWLIQKQLPFTQCALSSAIISSSAATLYSADCDKATHRGHHVEYYRAPRHSTVSAIAR